MAIGQVTAGMVEEVNETYTKGDQTRMHEIKPASKMLEPMVDVVNFKRDVGRWVGGWTGDQIDAEKVCVRKLDCHIDEPVLTGNRGGHNE